MPIRDGRWVPAGVLKAERDAAVAILAVAAQSDEEPAPLALSRTQKAAATRALNKAAKEAAILAATGLAVIIEPADGQKEPE